MGHMRHLIREVERAQNKPNARMSRHITGVAKHAASRFHLESPKKMPAMQNIPHKARESHTQSIISKLRDLWRRNTR